MSPERTAAGPLNTSPARHMLAETFVLLADTSIDDYDVVALLRRLVMSCVDLLPVAGAGLLLKDQRGKLAVAASSSEAIRLLEVSQLQAGAGPCLDAVHQCAPVITGNLDDQRARWPSFVEAAAAAGFGSVVTLPLRLREQTIGGLDLFNSRHSSMTLDDQRLAQALADVATIGILHQRSAHRSSQLTENLQFALNSRVLVEQAKGVVAERNGVDMDAAFGALRRHARNHNLKLADVAASVVSGALDPSSIPSLRSSS